MAEHGVQVLISPGHRGLLRLFMGALCPHDHFLAMGASRSGLHVLSDRDLRHLRPDQVSWAIALTAPGQQRGGVVQPPDGGEPASQLRPNPSCTASTSVSSRSLDDAVPVGATAGAPH